jgi:hypothetical protein
VFGGRDVCPIVHECIEIWNLLAIENPKKSLQFGIFNVEKISGENSPVNKILVSSNTGNPLSRRRKIDYFS